MNWVAVETALPPDYEEVLFFALNEGGTREIMTGHREKGHWTHCCMFYSTMTLNERVTVTHWMPLPDYPKPANLSDYPTIKESVVSLECEL